MVASLLPELLIKHPSGESQKTSLTRMRTTIGRSGRNDVCITDAFASRVHAELRVDGESVWLSDLGSANGTRVNGELLVGSRQLRAGDEFRIGETLFEVLLGKVSQRVAPVIASGTEALDPAHTVSFRVKDETGELGLPGASSRNELLGLIGKVGVTLLSSGGLDETLEQVAGLVFDAVPAERCVVMLKDGVAGDGMRTAVARSRGSAEPIEGVVISHTVLDEVFSCGKAVLTSDAQHDPRYASDTMSLLGVRSVLAVPLSVDGADIFGMVYADAPAGKGSFTEEHLNILTTLASVAAIRVERARFLDEQLAKERYERELALASEIQQRFLPTQAPTIEGFEMQGISFSCYEIGGDYYDFIDRGDGRLMVAIGDVSGKGTGAALLMSSLHAALHGQVVAGAPLEDIPYRLNDYLSANTPSNTFVTLFLSEFDVKTGELRFINAGHNPPILCRASGEMSPLTAGGLPLGLMRHVRYECGSDTVRQGDAVVMYSDGVTEAVNPAGEEFGMVRLRDAVREGSGDSAARLRDRIEKALSDFAATAPQSDDVTLVILRRTE